VRFIGEENEININTKSPEFIDWKWIDINLLPSLVVEFKKHIYEDVLKELKKIID
jgi:putative (di)nucleoside polyphosphate hydrolase